MIQAVIFDFGNVICSLDNLIFLKKISSYTNKSVPQLDRIIYRESGLPVKYESGQISSQIFFEEVSRLCGLSMDVEDFRVAYTDIFTPIPSTYDVIKKLKSHYKLGLLSNTSHWDFEWGIKPIEIYGCFDTVTLSYEVKAMKPSPLIFQDTLSKLVLPPVSCVYIDDLQENVDAALELGFNAYRYTTHSELVQELADLGVLFS